MDSYGISHCSMWHSDKESASHCRRCRRGESDPWVGKIPWGRNGNPLQFGNFHAQRSLEGYSLHYKTSLLLPIVPRSSQNNGYFKILMKYLLNELMIQKNIYGGTSVQSTSPLVSRCHKCYNEQESYKNSV